MTEWEFLSEVVERADCGILLDVNNIYVSSINHEFDPFEYVDFIPAERVAQMHIAGNPHVKSPNPEAPPFALVAQMPSTTELSLKVFLRSSHKNMPNFILSSDEIDSVTAYILGLKKK